nr:zinc finger, CCHC-type, retrotransposon Gag domain protein [Tanacetum cinerariifolium]
GVLRGDTYDGYIVHRFQELKNALQTLLPQIRVEIREEFSTSSGPSDAGGNPPSITIHTWLEHFNKQKPRSFEKAIAPVDVKNWISHMEKIFDVMGCEDAFKTRLAMYKFEAVYYIWQERNNRLFKNEKREIKTVLNIAKEALGMKLMGLKVKESRTIREVEEMWNVKMKEDSKKVFVVYGDVGINLMRTNTLLGDEFDNDNIIGEVTNDAQDPVNNQASDGVDNSEALFAESIADVEDYDSFIDDEVAVDETTHDEYTHDEATDDDFDI